MKPSRSRVAGLLRGKAAQAMLAILILAMAALIALVVVGTAPDAERKPRRREARLVQVLPTSRSVETAVIHASGTVKPSRSVNLQPRVSGQIESVSEKFEPGAFFKEGEVLARLDRADFDLAVRTRSNDVTLAGSELELELGRSKVAELEYKLLGEDLSENEQNLARRKPQLAKARAALDVAEAALEQARLNRERSVIRAPFNAVVVSRMANVGMQVSPASTLALLAGTDTYWIEAPVPVSQLKWLNLPGPNRKGSTARVYNEAAWGKTGSREARLVRVAADLEEDGRMARLIFEVADPRALAPSAENKPELLLNDYVRLEIHGEKLEHVIPVGRDLVRDGDRVWVLKDGRLDIREVEIAFRGRDRFLLSGGIDEGELLITTDLAAPVEGMILRTEDQPVAEGAP